MPILPKKEIVDSLLRVKRQSARFSKVLKQSAICTIYRDLISQGVRHVDMPDLSRMKIVCGKLDEYRSNYLPYAIEHGPTFLDGDLLLFLSPFWYKRPVKSDTHYKLRGAVVSFDLVSEVFYVPAQHHLELFSTSHMLSDNVPHDEIGITNWIPPTERVCADESKQSKESLQAST